MNEVVVKSNNSLAVLGALADRLQCFTVSKIKNGSIPSTRNIDNRGEKKETLKTVMKIVGKL